MDTLFIQFYSRTSYPPTCFELGNGFSDTYDLCKQRGDFYWIRHYHEDTDFNVKFPIKHGTAFISALFIEHLYTAYQWAINYPNVKFIVGGPAVLTCFLRGTIPTNLILTEKSVEEWFNIPNFSNRWYLDIPKEIPENETIYFTYLLDNVCYWSKCIFCSYTAKQHKSNRVRKYLNFEFKDLQYNGRKMIRLGTDAILPKNIKDLSTLPVIDNLDGYRVFFRASKKEYEVMKSFENLNWADKIRFNIGLEFPTNRMWKYMKKGYNSNDVIELLKLIKNSLFLSMMLGWDNLLKSDLIDLEEFMKKIPHAGKYCSIKINKLFAIPGTFIHETYKKGKQDNLGPFYIGFYPDLSKEQIRLNEEAKQIILKYAKEKKYYVLDLYKS